MAHVSVSVPTGTLLDHLNDLLRPADIKDYSPNGLQVEGRSSIAHMICAVTASQNVVDRAVTRGADALLVHHGYFWKGEDPRIIGVRKRRLAALLKADINLIAYHLPLDVHPVYGNNARLGLLLGWAATAHGGETVGRDAPLIAWHDLEEPIGSDALRQRLSERLDREPLLVGDLSRQIRRIAWCTGGAQDFLQQAIDLGADCFISGEISERTTHLAREAGVVYVAAGHHATERGGVQALGRHLAEHFGIEVDFIDDPNPA
ncbi:MAG: Nif3-like dinuclear metal center hexameric protein [Lautropia sp.]|nr:Nif3-like dinuclear metal center hexameric protein [Lautropia sp.]